MSLIVFTSCTQQNQEKMNIDDRLDQYTEVKLKADLSALSDDQKAMVPLLIEAANAMDEAFWMEAYGSKQELMAGLDDPKTKRFAEINYGPWDRLNGNEPFVDGVGEKPLGANFYPEDMTKEEFEAWESDAKNDLYTMVRRDLEGELITIPYAEFFMAQHIIASENLREASKLAPKASLKKYLELRAEALLNDQYRPSDMAWMDMKDNQLDVVIGPIETYEDQLFGYKAAHEAYVLVKDLEWSSRLEKYAAVLPELQKGLPVDEKYKQETPGSDSDLGAYDVIYYSGDCNAGSKTIAINLPNDEKVQLEKGTRRLQLKNAIKAKYDKILKPMTEVLIAEDQREMITFDAFFSNTMFHEVAHGLGIKNVVGKEMTVREALKDKASSLEEGKADVLGLYMITELRKKGMIEEGSLEENMVTFFASIFRSIRFGTSSSHGRANLIRFNYFKEKEAFTFDTVSQTYKVDFEKMQEASESLSRKILTLQGDGNYQAVSEFVDTYMVMGEQLKANLDRLGEQNIPVDVTFEQGLSVLGMAE